MSNTRFLHYLKVIAVIHVAVVLGIVVSGGCRELFARKNKTTIVPVEFVVAVPQSAYIAKESTLVREPVKVKTPTKEPKPAPVPQSKKHEVKVNNQRVVRQAGVPDIPKTLLSPEEIERRLKMGAKAGHYNTPIPDGDLLAFTIIKQTLYDAWTPPDKEAVGDVFAEISIKIAGDGSLFDKRMDKVSGNSALDASVMQAINSVQRVYGLNTEFLNKYANKSITIAFKVE